MTTIYRPSTLPLAFRCPGSIHRSTSDDVASPACDATFEGSAIHAVIADALRGVIEVDPHNIESVQPYADRFEVPKSTQQIAWAALFGVIAIRQLQEEGRFGYLLIEQPIDVIQRESQYPFGISGTVDLMSMSAESIDIVDFKSGRDSSLSSVKQLLAYALSALHIYPAPQVYNLYVVWLRDKEIETYRFTKAQVMDFGDELLKRVHHWDQVLRPGSHCRFCNIQNCPGRNAVTKSAGAMLEAVTGEKRDLTAEWSTMSMAEQGDYVITMTEGIKVIESKIKQFKDWRKDRLPDESGVMFRGSDGRTVNMKSAETKRVNISKALATLEEFGIGGSEIFDMVSLTNKNLETTIKSKAKPQCKAALVKDVWEALGEAGAVNYGQRQTITVKGESK